MDFSESVKYIESLSPTTEKPSLERIALFFREADEPQNSIPTIHVGGTNGKGSTAVCIDTLLQALGLKVGRFTGPHLFSLKERISINGKEITDREFARLVTQIRRLSEEFGERHPELGKLSWFEVLTAMAIFKFKQERVDCCVLEVGLGGRFDATNASNNVLATVITNIDLDHTHILGNTLADIAFEKAGIMKPAIPVVTYANPVALKELKVQAEKKGTQIVHDRESIDNLIEGASKSDNLLLSSAGPLLESLSLVGPHQKVNAALALTALSLIDCYQHLITPESIKRMKKSLRKVYWPGRMQIVAEKKLIMDVAHNPASARVLRQALDQLGESGYIFCVGFYMSKDVPGFLKNLLTSKDRVIACDLNTKRRFYKKEDIAEICQDLGVECTVMPSVEAGLDHAFSEGCCNSYLVATGSFATVRSTMEFLGWNNQYINGNCRSAKYNQYFLSLKR